MVLGPGTHVEEPVFANGMLEVPMDFVKMSRTAEQFYGMKPGCCKRELFWRVFFRKCDDKITLKESGAERLSFDNP